MRRQYTAYEATAARLARQGVQTRSHGATLVKGIPGLTASEDEIRRKAERVFASATADTHDATRNYVRRVNAVINAGYCDALAQEAEDTEGTLKGAQ